MNNFIYKFLGGCSLTMLVIALSLITNDLSAQDCCDQGDKPNSLTMVYTGEGCSATNTSQDPGKYNCDDFGGGTGGQSSVYIVASSGNDGSGEVYFTGNVTLNGEFTATSANAGQIDFKSNTYFLIYSSQGGTLLQRVQMHTSCSAPIVAGEQVGSMFLLSATFKNGINCGPATPPGPPEECPVPVVTISSSQGQNNTTVCAQESIIFETDEPDCGEVTLTWDFGAGANPQTATGKGPHSVTYSSPGNYTVSLTADNNCDGGTGTTVCPPPPPPPIGSDCCDSFSGKPKKLTLVYTGEGCGATNTSQQSSKYECDNFNGGPNGDPNVYITVTENSDGSGKNYFSGNVPINDAFVANAGNAGDNEFKSKVYINVYSSQGGTHLQRVNMHTSCSAPLVPGENIGGILLESAEWSDGSFCDVTGGSGGGSGGADCCDQGDKPNSLTFLYNGESCSNTSTSQDPGKYECDNFNGGPNGDPSVYIIASENSNGGGKIYFAGTVDINTTFTATSAMAGDNEFKSKTYFNIYSSQGGTLRQRINVHTSCSAPIVSGDQFGSLVLQSATFKNGVSCGPVTPPGPNCVDCEETVEVPVTVINCNVLGSIGDYVFNDLDQDGVQDFGEPGVHNIPVQLKDCSNNVLDATVTNANGFYTFNDLPQGCYRVGFIVPGDFTISPQNVGNDALDSDIDPVMAMTGNINLGLGENDPTNDAGIFQNQPPVLGKLGDFVWFDQNSNGQQDFGEPGIPNAFVMLMTCGGNFLDFTFTDANGMYMFNDLEAGCYKVFFANPNGSIYMFTNPNSGNDATDSDAAPDGNTGDINLGAGETNLTIDAGFKPVGGGPVCDVNLTISNIICDGKNTVTTTDDTYTFDVTVTGTNTSSTWQGGFDNGFLGAFAIGPTPYGTTITLGPFPAGEFTSGNTSPPITVFDGLDINVQVSDSQDGSCADATTVQSPGPCSPPPPISGSLGDRVFNDLNQNGQQDFGEPGVDGVTVQLKDCGNNVLSTTVTAGGGIYTFGNLQAGCYRVGFVLPAGFSVSPQNVGNDATDSDVSPSSLMTGNIDLGPGENDPTNDAGIFQSTICDNVTFGGKVGFGATCAGSFEICDGNGGFGPIIGNCDSPTGGSGALEVIWLRNPVNCDPIAVTVAQLIADPSSSPWEIVPGATGLSLDPGFVSSNTCYQRCARRAGCDQYLGESNIVQISVNPNCGGGGAPNCDDITISSNNGTITIGNLGAAPFSSVKVFNSGWGTEFSCFADCGGPTVTVNVDPGTYYVYAGYVGSNYSQICEINTTVNVTNGGGGPCASQGGDSDGDGVCNNQDCAPFDPSLPTTPGTSCNDGNPNTSNDQIQSDGCTCAGTVVSGCAGQGGDSDGDGVCNNQDCQPYNASYPATPGSSCDDGDPNTTNDQVTADGCGCAGTIVTPDCSSIPNSIGNLIYMGEYNGSKYYCSNTNSNTWSQAQAAIDALAYNGYLVVINDAGENTFIKNNIIAGQAWIGYTDEGYEGNFDWVNGDNDSYTNWASGEPNNQGSSGGYADYAIIEKSNGKWYDRNGGDHYEFVIEIPCDMGGPSTVLPSGQHPKFINELPNIPRINATNGGTYNIGMEQSSQWLGLVDASNNPVNTTVWGYTFNNNQMYLGPTFMAKKDVPVNVKWINNLPMTHLLPVDESIHKADPNAGVPTVVHLHGGHSEKASDGFPEAWFTQNFAETGPEFEKQTYHYQNDQEAAPLWYHDHTLGMTRLNVYAGLAGMYLLRDENELALDLPTGEYERELVIQDKQFASDGSLYFPALLSDPEALDFPTNPAIEPTIFPEFFGDYILVNGATWPKIEVEPTKYRFRLLNASDSRFYIFKLSNNATFQQIGSDGGLLTNPVSLNQLVLAPGERADIIIDFSTMSGQSITLQNIGPDEPFKGLAANQPAADPNTTGVIMRFDVSGSTNTYFNIPSNLRSAYQFYGPEVNTRQLLLLEGTDQYGRLKPSLGTAQDGELAWVDPTTELPVINETEVWEVYNNTEDAHPIHIHQISFQLVNRQAFVGDLNPTTSQLTNIQMVGAPIPPAANEQGWKDTYIVPPGQVARFKVRFDIPGKFVWHCHILSHEDWDMMRTFEVVSGPGGGGTGDCADINITSSPGKVSVSGLNGVPITSLQVFSNDWTQQFFNCFGDCGATETINLTAGSYKVLAKYYDAGWAPICEVLQSVNVSSNLGSNEQMAFEAAKYEEHAELVFVHNAGLRVDAYTFERSLDGQHFDALDTYASKGGTTSELYVGYDFEPSYGDHHYRVRMDMKDGTVEYSEVRILNFPDLIHVLLFPNPANEFVKANVEDLIGFQDVTITLFNNLGVAMKQFELDEVHSRYYQMDIRDLREGHYIVWFDIPGRRALAKQLVIGKR